jgi:hypothetical protein
MQPIEKAPKLQGIAKDNPTSAIASSNKIEASLKKMTD